MKQSGVEHWVRDDIRQIQPYHVPPAGDAIKLDAMENPFPWPGVLQKEWFVALNSVEANRYPDPAANKLRAALWQWMQVDDLDCADDLELMLGNGSDEIIQLLAMLMLDENQQRCIVAPEPGFVMYKMIAAFTGLKYVGVPLAEDFTIDLPAMLDTIKQHQPALVFLAYPNNPTGNLFDKQALRAVIEASPGLVIADEAYSAFSSDSMMTWLDEYPHLMLMRTMSKLGLAGLRLGMLLGRKAWMTELNKLRLPYNINSLTQASAEFALQHVDVLEAQAAELVAERSRLAATLAELPGVTVFPSQANFLLFKVSGDAVGVHAVLLQHKILIKKLHGAHPQLDSCLRVTVGTAAENNAFIAALKKILPVA